MVGAHAEQVRFMTADQNCENLDFIFDSLCIIFENEIFHRQKSQTSVQDSRVILSESVNVLIFFAGFQGLIVYETC